MEARHSSLPACDVESAARFECEPIHLTRHYRWVPLDFLSRCSSFSAPCVSSSGEINCTGLWDKFFHAFSNRDPCDQKPSYYDDFFSASAFDTPSAEKTLFWSGTTVLAHEYSNDGLRYTTLEDTLPGYVLNGLRWCGSLSKPWYNEKTCPKCPPTVPWDSFWRAASRSFAKRARGDVFVMLSGTRKDQEGKPIDAFVNTRLVSIIFLDQ
ncbi:ADP-ribosyl cyclase/cyclic ADP-ribose hydrolase-like [Branchiostoma floridae x Branchiostoma belcheri]